MDEKYRNEMANDMEKTLEKSGIRKDDPFVANLKKFHTEKGINNIGNLKVDEVHNSMAKDLGLESKW